MKQHCVRVNQKQLERLKTGILQGMGEKHLAWSEYTPLYEKGINKYQNKPMETSVSNSKLEDKVWYEGFYTTQNISFGDPGSNF